MGYNPVIGRDPWTQLATFSADTHASGYDAPNLATYDLNQVYRSTATTCVISATFSKPVPVGMIGIIRHNLTQGASFRLQLYSDAAYVTQKYDSDADAALVGSGDVWPITYDPTALDFEDDNGFTCQPRTEELTGQSWDRIVWWNDVRYLIQSLKLTLTNTHNPAGYLQVGHLAIARGQQFSRGIAAGASSGYAPNSIVTQADGGREYGQLKMKPVVIQTSFPSLPRPEAELIKQIKRARDIVPEQAILWHQYPQDVTLWAGNSGLFRFAELSLHQIATPARDSVPISLRQVM